MKNKKGNIGIIALIIFLAVAIGLAVYYFGFVRQSIINYTPSVDSTQYTLVTTDALSAIYSAGFTAYPLEEVQAIGCGESCSYDFTVMQNQASSLLTDVLGITQNKFFYGDITTKPDITMIYNYGASNPTYAKAIIENAKVQCMLNGVDVLTCRYSGDIVSPRQGEGGHVMGDFSQRGIVPIPKDSVGCLRNDNCGSNEQCIDNVCQIIQKDDIQVTSFSANVQEKTLYLTVNWVGGGKPYTFAIETFSDGTGEEVYVEDLNINSYQVIHEYPSEGRFELNYCIYDDYSTSNNFCGSEYIDVIGNKPPPKPTPKSLREVISEIWQGFWGWVKDLFGFGTQQTIVGSTEVTPGTDEIYHITMNTHSADSDYSDGTYSVQYGIWALVDNKENIIREGQWEEIDGVYDKYVTITIPNKVDDYVLVGLIDEINMTYNLETNVWEETSEEIILEEGINLKTKLEIPVKPAPKIKIFEWIKNAWDWFIGLFNR